MNCPASLPFILSTCVALLLADGALADEIRSGNVAVVRMSVQQTEQQLAGWLRDAGIEPGRSEAALAVWRKGLAGGDLTAEDALDLLISSLATADDETAALQRACHSGQPPGQHSYTGIRAIPFYGSNVRVWHARVLAQQRYYDEAVALLADVSVQDLVDPASLLFYRGISRLKLLQKSAAADDLALLLNNTADVPARFRQMALQVQEEAAKPAGPLGEVAQLMSDVQRRLDLGAADEPVQKREDEVVAALDKLLKDLEEQQKQQQQQQQQQQQGGGAMQPSQPGSRSQISGSQGKGEADRKELTESGAWGMLDKEREAQAKELIRQQFPPNFLDAISRYTRRIAEQKK